MGSNQTQKFGGLVGRYAEKADASGTAEDVDGEAEDVIKTILKRQVEKMGSMDEEIEDGCEEDKEGGQ